MHGKRQRQGLKIVKSLAVQTNEEKKSELDVGYQEELIIFTENFTEK